MSTVYEKNQNSNYVFCKGAADFILPKCTQYINENGHIIRISPDRSED